MIIDTDPAMGTLQTDPEDGMAILYALNSPEVTLDGITLVHGNVPISQSWPNTKHLLSLAGRSDVPLHAGAAVPRSGARLRQRAWLEQRAGMDRLAPSAPTPDSTAVEFLVDAVCGSSGQVTVVAIGPLTNIADAIESDPRFARDLAGLVVMGGAAAVPGNVTPAAEFNIWMDPESADVVFRSGASITMVGLDVCHRTRFPQAQVDALSGKATPLAEFVAAASTSWNGMRELLFDSEGMHLYDTLAVAAAVEPDLLTYQRALVEIETSAGPAQGMTVTHLNDLLRQLLSDQEPNTGVALDVDVDRFTQRFVQRVLEPL